mmetsp:Transcript_14049/g.17865  ORF Transcript_14049/g.17865 Transcript_14049/m.17865 type:complete len:222 (+) Transcript_14049:87-752(+)
MQHNQTKQDEEIDVGQSPMLEIEVLYSAQNKDDSSHLQEKRKERNFRRGLNKGSVSVATNSYSSSSKRSGRSSACAVSPRRGIRSMSLTSSFRKNNRSRNAKNNIADNEAILCSRSTRRTIRSLSLPRILQKKSHDSNKEEEKRNERIFINSVTSGYDIYDDKRREQGRRRERELMSHYGSDDDETYTQTICHDLEDLWDYWSQTCDEILEFIFVLDQNSS